MLLGLTEGWPDGRELGITLGLDDDGLLDGALLGEVDGIEGTEVGYVVGVEVPYVEPPDSLQYEKVPVLSMHSPVLETPLQELAEQE
jgi:hypothetical protein